MEFIYIIESTKTPNSNIYQICRTTDFNIINSHDIIFCLSCDDGFNTKIKVLDYLQDNNKYINMTEYGHDYFKGNIDDLVDDFQNFILQNNL